MDNLSAVFEWGLSAKVGDFPEAVAATHFNYLEQALGWVEQEEEGPKSFWDPSSLTGQLCHGWKGLIPEGELSETQRQELLGHWLASFEVASRIGVALWLKPTEFRLAQQNTSFLLMFASRTNGLSASHLTSAVQIALSYFSQGSHSSENGQVFGSNVDPVVQGRLCLALVIEVIEIVKQEVATNRGYLGTSRLNAHSEWSTDVLNAPLLFIGEACFAQHFIPHVGPGPLLWQAGLRCLEEILNRHIKAASKRLRWDQVKHIDLRLPVSRLGTTTQLKRILASYIIHHSWVPDSELLLSPDELETRTQVLCSKITILASPVCLQRANDRLLEGLSSLFAGCSDEQLRNVLGNNYRRFRKLPFMNTTFTGRPVAPMTELAVQLRQFEMLLPAEMDLYTSRGGCWPAKTDV